MMQSHSYGFARCGFAAPKFTNLLVRWDGGSEIQPESCTHHAVIQTIFINTAGRLAKKNGSTWWFLCFRNNKNMCKEKKQITWCNSWWYLETSASTRIYECVNVYIYMYGILCIYVHIYIYCVCIWLYVHINVVYYQWFLGVNEAYWIHVQSSVTFFRNQKWSKMRITMLWPNDPAKHSMLFSHWTDINSSAPPKGLGWGDPAEGVWGGIPKRSLKFNWSINGYWMSLIYFHLLSMSWKWMAVPLYHLLPICSHESHIFFWSHRMFSASGIVTRGASQTGWSMSKILPCCMWLA